MDRKEAIKLFRRDIECLSHDKCSDCILEKACDPMKTPPDSEYIAAYGMAIEALSTSEIPNKWIPVSERLPETDNENNINNYDVLLWVKNKTYPEREPQIYIGKLRRVDGDDGSGNFWGMETKPCEWTIWGWSYFFEPEVVAWMPLPEPYKAESEDTDGK